MLTPLQIAAMSAMYLYTLVLFKGSVNNVNILLSKGTGKGPENIKELLQHILSLFSGMLHVGIIPASFLCSRSTGSTVRFQKLKYRNIYSAEI